MHILSKLSKEVGWSHEPIETPSNDEISKIVEGSNTVEGYKKLLTLRRFLLIKSERDIKVSTYLDNILVKRKGKFFNKGD